jgi:hypothetical protein
MSANLSTTLCSILNIIGRTYVLSQEINKHALSRTITKSWKTSYFLMLHCRYQDRYVAKQGEFMRSQRMFASTLTWDPQNEGSNTQRTQATSMK